MKKVLLTLTAAVLVSISLKAQDSTSTPLSISGSVDAYWKYDFAKTPNIGTSFATDQNSVSLGMIDIALKKSTGKASFVGEIAFGPRGQYQSIPTGDANDGSNTFNIQNLYATYAFTDKFSMTAGYMGTFVGYEVISPVGNANYSTSYLFTNGPFQNAGIKANYAISSKVGIMVGLFNDWNTFQDGNGVSDFGAQLFLSPVEGWSAYINYVSGQPSGSILDLTTSYQITDKFKLGLNAATRKLADDSGYDGAALYSTIGVAKGFDLALRGEYFKVKDVGPVEGNAVTALTFSGILKSGSLSFIPEFRIDSDKQSSFVKSDLITPTKSASQFSLALVYAF
jgi:hypothetical protein